MGNRNIVNPSVEIQTYFTPERILPTEPIGLDVRVIPLGNYEDRHYEALKRAVAENATYISVQYTLPGFRRLDYQEGEDPSRIFLNFRFDGEALERRIGLEAHDRPDWSTFRQDIFLNGMQKQTIGGFFVPSAFGYSLGVVGDGYFPIIELFSS